MRGRGPKPGLRPVVEQVEQHLRAIGKAVRRPLDAEFAKGNLTGPQRSLMAAVVDAADGLTLKELAAQLGLAHSTVSVMAARLIERGLLSRKEHPTDRRATLIVASQPVRDFLRKQMPKLARSPISAALRRASNAEQRLILTALERLRALLEAE